LEKLKGGRPALGILNFPSWKMIPARVTKKRSLLKAFTYRFICSAETWIVTTLAFGSYFAFPEMWADWLPWFSHSIKGVSAVVAIVLFFTKVGTYYFHDRGWTHIKWGQKRRTKEEKITYLEIVLTMTRKGHDVAHCKCPLCRRLR
jgi:hypothetical protein